MKLPTEMKTCQDERRKFRKSLKCDDCKEQGILESERNLSGRRELFTFPYPDVNAHTSGFGSFIVHGALKALRTHVRR